MQPPTSDQEKYLESLFGLVKYIRCEIHTSAKINNLTVNGGFLVT